METSVTEQTFQLAVFIFAFFSAFLFLILLGIDYFTRFLVEEYTNIVNIIKEERKRQKELRKKADMELEGLSKISPPAIAKTIETVVKAEEKK